jgi:hypothetical protein
MRYQFNDDSLGNGDVNGWISSIHEENISIFEINVAE